MRTLLEPYQAFLTPKFLSKITLGVAISQDTIKWSIYLPMKTPKDAIDLVHVEINRRDRGEKFVIIKKNFDLHIILPCSLNMILMK